MLPVLLAAATALSTESNERMRLSSSFTQIPLLFSKVHLLVRSHSRVALYKMKCA